MTNIQNVSSKGQADHKFTIGLGSNFCASSAVEGWMKTLQDAAAGGAPLFNFFQGEMAILNRLFYDVATSGDSAWIDGEDSTTGYPTVYVANKISDTSMSYLTVGVYLTDQGKEILKNGSSGSSPENIGFSYITMTVKTADETKVNQVATNMVQYFGQGIPNVEVGDGLKSIIKGNVKVAKKFLSIMADLAFGGRAASSVAAARDNATSNAAKASQESEATGEKIVIGEGEEITADIGYTAVDAIGLVLSLGALVVTVILSLLSKEIAAFARVYNMTKADLDFSVCWVKKDSALAVAPMLPQNPFTIPKVGPVWTPPWIIGENPIPFIDLVFANTDSLKGVGYVLKARPTGDFPGFNVMVNIPNDGANSLYASFIPTDDCDGYWNSHKDKDTGLVTSATSQDGKYKLILATNQGSGKSPSPMNGEEGYNYEHLLLIQQIG